MTVEICNRDKHDSITSHITKKICQCNHNSKQEICDLSLVFSRSLEKSRSCNYAIKSNRKLKAACFVHWPSHRGRQWKWVESESALNSQNENMRRISSQNQQSEERVCIFFVCFPSLSIVCNLFIEMQAQWLLTVALLHYVFLSCSFPLLSSPLFICLNGVS